MSSMMHVKWKTPQLERTSDYTFKKTGPDIEHSGIVVGYCGGGDHFVEAVIREGDRLVTVPLEELTVVSGWVD